MNEALNLIILLTVTPLLTLVYVSVSIIFNNNFGSTWKILMHIFLTISIGALAFLFPGQMIAYIFDGEEWSGLSWVVLWGPMSATLFMLCFHKRIVLLRNIPPNKQLKAGADAPAAGQPKVAA